MAFFLPGMSNRDVSKAWPTEPGWDSLSAKDARVCWSEVHRALWEYETIIAVSLCVLTQDQHLHSARLWSLVLSQNHETMRLTHFIPTRGEKRFWEMWPHLKKMIYSSLERHCFCNSELNLQDLQLWQWFIIAVVTVSHIFVHFLVEKSWAIFHYSVRFVEYLPIATKLTVVNDVNNFWTVTSRKANIWMTIHSREGSP